MVPLAPISLLLGGLLGASGVGLGAFGAHALKATLDARGQTLWQTASVYHLLHAAALTAAAAAFIALKPAHAVACGLCVSGLFLGTVIFSGSLYALALGAPKWIGAVTPVGGVGLIMGWLALAWVGLQHLGDR